MSLTSKIVAQVVATLTKSLDLSTPTDAVSPKRTVSFADGTGAGQADVLFTDKRTLADGISEDLDLSGSLVDGLGDAITLARVRAILIVNLGTLSTLKVGGAAANQFLMFDGADDVVTIRQGGLLLLADGDDDVTGYPVTAGTGDLLKILHGGEDTADLDYEIIIVGASA